MASPQYSDVARQDSGAAARLSNGPTSPGTFYLRRDIASSSRNCYTLEFMQTLLMQMTPLLAVLPRFLTWN